MSKIKDNMKCLIQKLISVIYKVFFIFKIDSNKVICINFSGKGYGDSPKYIAEEFIKNNLDYKILWVYKGNIKKNQNYPPQITLIKKYSLSYFYNMATSKFWISNNRIELYISKRKKQIYIQTWHGGIALKKIEYDAKDSLSYTYINTMKKDNKNIDYMLSNSDFCTEMYKKAFKFSGNILEIGTPRNDILVNHDEVLCCKAKRYYGIDNEKVLLYVPTFRKDYNFNPYDIDFKLIQKMLEKDGSKWKIIIRLHPVIKNPANLIRNFDRYINACDYPDIQELILASDLIITDYSATMFEGMIAKKPVLLYAKDIESYIQDRGFYFSFDELPFEIIRNNDELKAFPLLEYFSDYDKEYKKFEEKIGLKETGDSCNKIVQLICELNKS